MIASNAKKAVATVAGGKKALLRRKGRATGAKAKKGPVSAADLDAQMEVSFSRVIHKCLLM